MYDSLIFDALILDCESCVIAHSPTSVHALVSSFSLHSGFADVHAKWLLIYVRLAGTDITIFGTLTQAFSTDAPNLTYSVILDGTATTNFISHLSPNAVVETATTDILASFTGLTEGFHSLLLTLRNPGTGAVSGNLTAGPILAFDRVQVQMGAGKPRCVLLSCLYCGLLRSMHVQYPFYTQAELFLAYGGFCVRFGVTLPLVAWFYAHSLTSRHSNRMSVFSIPH